MTLLLELLSTSNLDEPTPGWNQPATIVGVTILFSAVSWICVVLRLYARVFVVKSPGMDDVFVLLYLLSGVVGTTGIFLAQQGGLGQHIILLTGEQITKYLKAFYIVSASYCTSTAFIKLSLLFQYQRILRKGSIQSYFCLGLTVAVGLWGAAYMFMSWVPEFPVEGYWDYTMDANRYGFGSLDADVFFASWTAHTASNMVLDILTLAMAVPIYFQDSTGQRMRANLILLAILGVLVNVLSMLRLWSLVQNRAATWPVFDPTWYGPVPIMLALMEVNLASVCASVPVFWPVISSRFHGIFVTQEIKVTRAPRWDASDREDEIELHTDGGEPGVGSIHSRAGSDSSQGKLTIMQLATSGKKAAHYQDEYVMEQVDPLRQKAGAVEAQVSVGRKKEEL